MKNTLLIFLFFAMGLLKGQSAELFDKIVAEYESFNYEEVVRLANLALEDTSRFKTDDLIEIYLMKSVAHFTSNDEDLVRNGFIEILKIDNNYKLDPLAFSPKIISLFEKVKNEFTQILGELNEPQEKQTPVTIIPPVRTITDTLFITEYKGFAPWTYLKSALLPGWGHIDSGNEVKGYILSGVSFILAGTAVYYAMETSSREKEYLNASSSQQISEKYNSYNSAYQIRNGLILGYLSVWFYSQFDLVLTGEIENSSISSVSGAGDVPSDINFSFSIRF